MDLVFMALHVYGHFVRQVVAGISVVVDLEVIRTIPILLAVTRNRMTPMRIKIRRVKKPQVRGLHHRQHHPHAAYLQLCLIALFSALLQRERARQLLIVQLVATRQLLDAAQPGQQ